MHQYKSVLVAVDFSANSKVALMRGMELAQRYSASLKIIHVVDIPTYPVLEDVSVMGLPGVLDPQLTEPLTQVATKQLTSLLVKIGLDESDGDLLVGDVPAEIVNCVSENSIDLLVLGKHGTSGWKKIFGSTASHIMNNVGCDVLAINLDKE